MLEVSFSRSPIFDSHMRTSEIIKHDIVVDTFFGFFLTGKLHSRQQFSFDRLVKGLDFPHRLGMLLPGEKMIDAQAFQLQLKGGHPVPGAKLDAPVRYYAQRLSKGNCSS